MLALQRLTKDPTVRKPQVVLRFYDSVCRLWGRSPEEFHIQQLPRTQSTTDAQAFGRKPNALPTHCNCLKAKGLAPRARFELATLRLTAECSTVELPGNGAGGFDATTAQTV